MFYTKKTINIWDANVDDIVISKLAKAKTNSKNFDWIFSYIEYWIFHIFTF